VKSPCDVTATGHFELATKIKLSANSGVSQVAEFACFQTVGKSGASRR